MIPALPSSSLARVRLPDGEVLLALSIEGSLIDLRPHTMDSLLRMSRTDLRSLLESQATSSGPRLDRGQGELLAPVESQEVWAAGVTYLRSREGRREEAALKDIYSQVYEAARPELFYKAAGWRVVGPGGEVGVRADSAWDVPEPELAVLSNASGEVVGYSCGNDMSSRSIEGENPLYLPQAKIYDRSCSIGPAAVLAWSVDVSGAAMTMAIERDGIGVFVGAATTAEMVRAVDELVAVLHSAYTLPVGAWLLTGTSIVPEPPYTARPGDLVRINIAGLGELSNRVGLVPHSGAQAKPRRP